MDPSASIGPDCRIGPNVSIGEGVEVGPGCRLRNCVVMKGAKVGRFACVLDSILGWGTRIAEWARVEGCVLGEEVACRVRSAV